MGPLAPAVFAGWGSIPLPAAFAFRFGALEVCYDRATETTVTTLVPRDRLERANGHLRSGAVAAQEFAGRPLGGVASPLGLFVPFLFDIAALAVSVVAVTPTVPVVAAVYVLAGGSVMVYAVAMTSIRQRITPDHLLGRVNAAMRTVGWGMSAVGMAAGGVLVASLTPALDPADALRAPYALVSVAGLAVVVFFGRRLTRLVREHDV
ncbi:hypothetical protein [Nocardiopsis sp. MG754419]|uniref:hypothetical protein n=1 Tax=Nocardiopsis sp. MG754419 TaxID=2259865 RepID=UPI002010F43E|nr:hypothetical protein [Nocardiopsis sp. MG754419]